MKIDWDSFSNMCLDIFSINLTVKSMSYLINLIKNREQQIFFRRININLRDKLTQVIDCFDLAAPLFLIVKLDLFFWGMRCFKLVWNF